MSRMPLCALLLLAALCGCASEVKREPVQLNTATAEAGRRYVLVQALSFQLASGYERSLRADTEFAAAGRIAQGLVLRPVNTVLTVEGAHMHEAYAVVQDGQLVGFYLPVERAFSALPKATSFPLVERTN